MDLQWFAQSGSTGEGGAAAGSDAGSQQAGGSMPQSRDAAGTEAPEKASFEELIRGEYKQDFDKRVQQIVKDRLKSARQAPPEQEELMEALRQKYGGGDTEEILGKLREEQDREAQRQRESQWERTPALSAQEEGLRKNIPDFSLEREMENPLFRRLVINQIPLETAWQVLHLNDLMSGALSYAARQVRQHTVNNIRQRGARPAENGLHQGAAVISRPSVKNLSKEDLIDIEKRVLRGEKITW